MLWCLQADPENANVYIGNLAAEVTDIELRQHVAQFGIVLDVKIYRKGGYAFAQVWCMLCHDLPSCSDKISAHLNWTAPCMHNFLVFLNWMECISKAQLLHLISCMRRLHNGCPATIYHTVSEVALQCLRKIDVPVQYASHADAVRSIVGLSGQNLGGKALKCSWGRHQARKAGIDPLQAGLPGDFSYLTQQQQQISLQQQLAMQQLGYPQG